MKKESRDQSISLNRLFTRKSDKAHYVAYIGCPCSVIHKYMISLNTASFVLANSLIFFKFYLSVCLLLSPQLPVLGLHFFSVSLSFSYVISHSFIPSFIPSYLPSFLSSFHSSFLLAVQFLCIVISIAASL